MDKVAAFFKQAFLFALIWIGGAFALAVFKVIAFSPWLHG